MNLYKLYILSTVILLCTACSYTDEQEGVTMHELVLNFSPCINTEVEVTRAYPYPAVFANNSLIPTNKNNKLNFGMWIFADRNTFVPYSDVMTNMECNYDMSVSPARWTFIYGGESHNILSVKPQGTGYDDIYLYCYFPYNKDVISPESIPVYSGKDELIYTPMVHKEAKLSRDTLNIPLNFRHAQACIEFRIVTSHSHAGLVLQNLKIEDIDFETENPILPLSSLYDIVNETYINQDMQFCKSIELNGVNRTLPEYNTDSKEMTPASVYLPLIPFDGYKNNRFMVTFNISGTYCKFKLPAIDSDNSGYMDLKAGYKYVYNLTLANEMIFQSGEIIKTNWSSGSETEIDI